MRRSLKAGVILGIILLFCTVLIPLNCLTSTEPVKATAAGAKVKVKKENSEEEYFTVLLKKQNKTENSANFS